MAVGRIEKKDISPPDPADALRILSRDPYPFLLESGIRVPRLGRYSLLGSDPFLVMTTRGREITLRRGDSEETSDGNPFHVLRELLDAYRLPPQEELPFTGGAVGYLSYDLGRFVERLPCTTLDDIGLPELYLAFYDTVLIIDHVEERAHIVAVEQNLRGRESAQARTDRLLQRLAEKPPVDLVASTAAGEIACNFTKAEYMRAVQRAKDYITAGDIFQVNLSRRFETKLALPPPELYLRLRDINPAPMAAYLQFDEGAVISASPERFLKVRGRHIETRPIKGTRPRGRTPKEDRALAEELLGSEKDNAELAMIVDLERNDIGRVCSYGSVVVTNPCVLESHPTVHHLVATVEGDLHERHDLVDLLKATFPGGSITGAPKIRAMEIIDELEPTRRSVYTGAVGYLGFDGNADLSIVIRTFLATRGRLYFQAGGGIVADSELEMEYDETTHKARALLEAVAGE